MAEITMSGVFPKLHIREGIEDNSKIFFLFLNKTYVVTPH